MKKLVDLRVRAAVAAIAVALAAAPAVRAQAVSDDPAAVENEGGLDEIVVTARKVEENLQSVPISITAFTGEELVKRNATALYDVQAGTPSLFMRTTSSTTTTLSIALRGQFQGSSSLNTDPSVATYVDGVYWARTFGLNANLVDVSSVQVLKGPQGTLFGRNTPGGAIVIETNKPDAIDLSARITGRFGSFNERHVDGFVNVPVVEDRVALRVAGEFTKRDGWAHDLVSGATFKNLNSWTVRGKLLLKPTDDFQIMFNAEAFTAETAGTANQLAYLAPNGLATPAPTAAVLAAGASAAAALQAAGVPVPAGINPFSYPATVFSVGALRVPGSLGGTNISAALTVIDKLRKDPNATYLDTPSYNFTKTWSAGFTAIADTNFAQFKLIAGYRNVRDIGISDADGSPYSILTFSGSGLRQEQWSTELQMTGKGFDDRLDFASGLYLFQESGDTSSATTGDYSTDNNSFGIYGQGTWHFSDKFSVSGGLRWSVDVKNSVQRTSTFEVSRRDRFDGVSFLIGAEYKPNPDTLLYAKVSRSFRSGGQNSLPSQPAFLPEQSTAYEIGHKGEYFNNRLRLNLAAYYSLNTDIQRTSFSALPNGNTVALIRNAGKLRIWGVEGDLSVALGSGFRFGGTIGITEPRYLEYRELPNANDLLGDRSSERIDSVPTFQFSLNGSYERTIGDVDFALRADYAWNNSYALMPNVAFVGDPLGVTVDPNTGKTIMQSIIDATTTEAGGVLNARASLGFGNGRYEVAVWGRNLFDRRDTVSALAVATLNFASIQRREPRTVGVELRAKFGGH